MRFLKEKASVIIKTMRYPESWNLPPRVTRALLKSLAALRPATAETGTILYINNPPVESVAFRRYLSGLKRIAGGENIPLVVHIAITDRCAYRCERCSNNFMRGTSHEEPSLGNLIRLLNALKAAGTVSVAFTGGEPALRNDLCELVDACRPEIAPLLFTSGQTIQADSARDLRRAGLAMAIVSFDSNVENEHDTIRGKAGAFRQAVQAVRHFLDAGIYTASQAVADSALLSRPQKLDELLRFCGELGVHEVILLDPMVFGDGCGTTKPCEEDREYLKGLHLLSATNRNMPKITTAAYLESADCLGCLAGYTFFYVNSAGDLCPCDFVPVSFGNVFEVGFETAFERARVLVRHPCTKCMTAQLAEIPRHQARLPLGREQTEAVFSRMKSSEPSAIMKLITR